MNTEKIFPQVYKQTDGRLIVVDPKSVATMQENVQQMGQYLMQMGQMMATMQRRMDEMEQRQAQVTISHAEVKRLQGLIRSRADEICGKYILTDKDSQRIIRAAIRKDVLKRCQVKDLHDIPTGMLPGVNNLVTGWANIRLVMERRAMA